MNIFLSHASADKKVVDVLKAMFDSSSTTFFYSSGDVPEARVPGGEDINETIEGKLESSTVVILVVTETYVRRPFCIYEACLAKYLQRKQPGRRLLVVFSDEKTRGRFPIELLPQRTLRTISATEPGAAGLLHSSLSGAGCLLTNDADIISKSFCDELKTATCVPGLPFVGMTMHEAADVWSFVEERGVEAIKSGFQCPKEAMSENLRGATDLYFVAMNGSGFLKANKEVLSLALKEGADLNVILPEQDSEMVRDVGEVESGLVSNNIARLNQEYDNTMQYLEEIRSSLAVVHGPTGKIEVFSSHTLLRQTVFLAVGKSGTLWGWMTCTLPPGRCQEDSVPTIVFSGKFGQKCVGDSVYRYCLGLKSLDEKRRTHPVSTGPTLDIRKHWRERTESANAAMERRRDLRDAVLIEVASQHPLLPDGRPGVEFSARLDKGAELYKKLVSDGKFVRIYVPGSIHKGADLAGKTSLSDAGCRYLVEKGIPFEVLFGDDANRKYKGSDGVYNSADECFVAEKLFEEGGFGRLLCVCASNQVLRKTLFYLEFGAVPECHAVTVEKGYHADAMREIFDSLNTVLYRDHDWQDRGGDCFRNSRIARCPGFDGDNDSSPDKDLTKMPRQNS